tara:strand:+ start:826 stop:945 length:120 start_codon:yes stop_codon:yes gene_type:complete
MKTLTAFIDWAAPLVAFLGFVMGLAFVFYNILRLLGAVD